MLNPRTVILIGHARLPKGMAARSVYETLALTTEVDAKYGVIIRCDSTLVTGLAREAINAILAGHSLRDGTEGIIQQLQHYYQGAAQNALIAAVKDLHRKWQIWSTGGRPVEPAEDA